MEQWQKIKAESVGSGQDSAKVAGLMEEGQRIIQRLQELDDLRRNPAKAPGEGLNQRIDQLQDRFKDLLRKIELDRVAHLPQGELETLKARYEEERNRLQDETRSLEDTVITRGEQFLATYKQNVNFSHYLSKQEMVVDFLYRLAEIYYRRGEDQFFTSNDITAFKPALEKYQRIIDEFPASDYVDDALYNIAYVKNSSRSPDDQQEAIKLYKTLIEKYATSPFVPEAYWRVGEYYFYHDPPQTQEAVKYYTALQNYPETHWYARGLYKVGWCHFRDADYPGAVEYFTKTVEASLDSASGAQDLLYASMLDEALQYISVCFAQDPSEWSGGGVASAVTFVQADSLRRNGYGRRVLEDLGDIYKFQTGKYSESNQAYQAFLNLYPLAGQAPLIREKMVNTYAVNLRDFAAAYSEKDSLYRLYRPGTEWAQVNANKGLGYDPDSIVEKYYFQNISETIGRALDKKDSVQVRQAVQLSRNYLETFPQGRNAYVVNFNMAVLLENNIGDDQEAYAEFIKVSKEYPDSSHKKESAVNAAVIAQKMINRRGAVPLDSLLGTPITEPEAKYLAATENYMNLFPQGEEAELFLLNAGAINYNHGLYEESRQYYNRLLSDFPNGSRRGEAYRFIMNGYFAQKNYTDAERVAKEIQVVLLGTAGFDSSLIAAAKTRQAESAFLGAQKLKDSGFSSQDSVSRIPNPESLLAAAAEYKRAALESPDYAQADKALFESGLAYSQAKAWKEADEVYLMLVQRYPQSALADKALYNVAYNSQAELGDKPAAAAAFERLASEYPKSALAQDALRNASVNYSEAGDWAAAIRVNSAYFQAYAGAADANVFLFENAGLYLKLGNQIAADQIYQDYSKRFPDDPRTVRAHWERGKFLLDSGFSSQDSVSRILNPVSQKEAYAEFNQGIAAHRKMSASGSPGEETYASRCLLEVIRADFAAYQEIKFTEQAGNFETLKKAKLARRDAILKQLEELNKMSKDEMLEGLYTVGRVEEELSQTFEHQEIPAVKGKPEESILAREVADQDAIEIASKAMAAYRKAADDIDAAATVLQSEGTGLQTRYQALSQWVAAAQKSDPQPKDLPDSTAALAQVDRGRKEVAKGLENASNWSARSRDKVPELALHNAEIKLSTVKAFLGLPDVGKREELRLAYRYGVLSEFAAPRGVEVIRLYRAALNETGRDSGFSNQDSVGLIPNPESRIPNPSSSWRQKALDGINELFGMLGDEFHALNERALGDYSKNLNDYQSLLARGEGAVNSDGLQAADVAEKLVFYSNQSFEYAKGALAARDSLLKVALADEDACPADLKDKCNRLMAAGIEEIFSLTQAYGTYAADASNAKEAAKARQKESAVWEDAAMTFEDCAYAFNDHQEALLNAALAFNQSHGHDQALSLRLAWALAGKNREKYLPLLAQYGQEAWLKSDESFRLSTSFSEGWDKPDFQDKNWSSPAMIDIRQLTDSATVAELAGAKALWVRPTKPDSGFSIQDSSLRTESRIPNPIRQLTDSVYVRKIFDVNQEPVAGDLWIKVDGGFALQVNGELVAAVEPSQATGQIIHYDVASLLKSGRNVITILAVDPHVQKNGLRLALKYKELPSPSYGVP